MPNFHKIPGIYHVFLHQFMPLSLYPQKQTTGDNLPFADTQNSITEDKHKDSKEDFIFESYLFSPPGYSGSLLL